MNLLNRRRFIAVSALLATDPSLSVGADNAIFPRLRRGMNFHHMLNWPRMNESGGNVEYQWPAFESPEFQTSESDLLRLKQAGFDFIRLTANPAIFILAGEKHFPELKQKTSEIITRLLNHGFDVVFDLHPVSQVAAFAPNKLMSNAAGAFEEYVRMVASVAEFLGNFPQGKVALELFNEPPLETPNLAQQWQKQLELLHSAARATAPHLPLVLSGIRWSDRSGLELLDLTPFKSSNVLYTFHYYDPHYYTHQGSERDDAIYVSGLQWPVTSEGAAHALTAALQKIAADPKAEQRSAYNARKILNELAVGHHTAATINEDFAHVANWADANNIPRERILLGEFGCVVSALGQNLGSDRLLWLGAVRKAAEEFGFGWAYWAFKGYGKMELVSSEGLWDSAVLLALGFTKG